MWLARMCRCLRTHSGWEAKAQSNSCNARMFQRCRVSEAYGGLDVHSTVARPDRLPCPGVRRAQHLHN